MMTASLRSVLGIAVVAALSMACAGPAHDTFGFKGVVYSTEALPGSRGTMVAAKGMLMEVGGSGPASLYRLKLDDDSIYAVRTTTIFKIGDCVAVYMSAKRAEQNGGFLSASETTIVPSTGCKAKVE